MRPSNADHVEKTDVSWPTIAGMAPKKRLAIANVASARHAEQVVQGGAALQASNQQVGAEHRDQDLSRQQRDVEIGIAVREPKPGHCDDKHRRDSSCRHGKQHASLGIRSWRLRAMLYVRERAI